jgi:ribonuclease-3
MDDLTAALGYRFTNPALLDEALTHTSCANEAPPGTRADNEALEFLGDAVLGFVVADVLHRECPQYTEGQKSKMKAALVSTGALAAHAERLGVGQALRLGRGEEKTGGRQKPAVLADALEAVIAAVYLDGGVTAARACVRRIVREDLAALRAQGSTGQDHKSALQEWLQAAGRPLPVYRVAGTEGPDHRKQFLVDVVIDGASRGVGVGPSKKEAEQEGARAALAALQAADADAGDGD